MPRGVRAAAEAPRRRRKKRSQTAPQRQPQPQPQPQQQGQGAGDSVRQAVSLLAPRGGRAPYPRTSTVHVTAGCDVREVRDLLAQAFSLRAQEEGGAVGLRDEDAGIFYPLSLLATAPGFFAEANTRFRLVCEGGSEPQDDNDDDNDSGGDDGGSDTLQHPQDQEEQVEQRMQGYGRTLQEVVGMSMDDVMRIFSKYVDEQEVEEGDEEDTGTGSRHRRHHRRRRRRHRHRHHNRPAGLSKRKFAACVSELLGGDEPLPRVVTDDLFRFFDRDGNGRIDVAEILAGLIVLCEGHHDHKVAHLFALFDADGDGYIDFGEMQKLLTAVFTIAMDGVPVHHDGSLHVTDDVAALSGSAARDLATATTEVCFEEADKNRDARISFAEFREWTGSDHGRRFMELVERFSSASNSSSSTPAAHGFTAATTQGARRDRAGGPATTGRDPSQVPQPRQEEATQEEVGFDDYYDPDQRNTTLEHLPSLSMLRQLTGLENETPHRLFSFFRMHAPKDYISRTVFRRVFSELLPGEQEVGESVHAQLRQLVDGLFDVFDTNKNGVVDFNELASGLSVLCGGSRDDQAMAAFNLCDVDKDGFITFDEMRSHLTSVFRMLRATADEDDAAQPAHPDLTRTRNARRQRSTGGFGDDVDPHNSTSKKRMRRGPAAQEEDAFDAARRARNGSAPGSTGVDNSADTEQAQGSRGTAAEGSASDVDSAALTTNRLLQAKSPEEWADLATAQCFQQADTDGTGRIDFGQFRRWYDASGQEGNADRMATRMFATAAAAAVGARDADVVDLIPASARAALQDSYDTATGSGAVGLRQQQQQQTRRAAAEGFDNNAGQFVALRMAIGVSHLTLEDSIDLFAMFADYGSSLSFDAFWNCVIELRRVAAQNKSHPTAAEAAAREAGPALRRAATDMFNLFNQDGSELLSTEALAAGLRALQHRALGLSADATSADVAQHDPVFAAFELYDRDQDGVISVDEMQSYLESVYRVVRCAPACSQEFDPDGMAKAAAAQIFAEADLSHLGYITLDHFRRVYGQKVFSAMGLASRTITLLSARELLGLQDRDAGEVFEHIMRTRNLSDARSVTRHEFVARLLQLRPEEDEVAVEAGEDTTNRDQIHAHVFSQLFDVFDVHESNTVDAGELLVGLSLLCGNGSLLDEIHSTFAAFDSDEDGLLDRDDMVRYLTSVFSKFFDLNPSLRANLPELGNTSIEDLADTTARLCFDEIDADKDDMLSLEEFSRWLTSSEQDYIRWLVTGSAITAATPRHLRKGARDAARAAAATANPINPNSSHQHQQLPQQQARGEQQQQRRIHFSDTEEVLGQSAKGARSRAKPPRLNFSFRDDQSGATGGGAMPFTPMAARDTSELGPPPPPMPDDAGTPYSTVSLTSSTRSLAGDSIYVGDSLEAGDENGDGDDCDDLSLAQNTDTDAFHTATVRAFGRQDSAATTGRDGTGSVHGSDDSSVDPETDVVGARLAAGTMSVAETVHLAQARTGLGRCSVNIALRIFRAFAGGEEELGGEWTRDQFVRAFAAVMLIAREILHLQQQGLAVADLRLDNRRDILARVGWRPETHLSPSNKRIAESLFSVFDANRNGVVEIDELAGGLSVLCGGTPEDRARAAFEMYDLNNNGTIAYSEMVSYSRSVMRLLFEMHPHLGVNMQIGPDELAKFTTMEAFHTLGKHADEELTFDDFLSWWFGKQGGGGGTAGANGGAMQGGTIPYMAFLQQPSAPIMPQPQTHALAPPAYHTQSLPAPPPPTAPHMSSSSSISSTGSFGGGPVSGASAPPYSSVYASAPPLPQFASMESAMSAASAPPISQVPPAYSVVPSAPPPPPATPGVRSPPQPPSYSSIAAGGDADAEFGAGAGRRRSVLLSQDLRPIMHMHKVTSQELFELLAANADDNGQLDRPAFVRALEALVPADGRRRRAGRVDDGAGTVAVSDVDGRFAAEAVAGVSRIQQQAQVSTPLTGSELRMALYDLFDVFDADQNGVIDFAELAAGLSVYCHDDATQKMRTLFALYDLDGDGFVTRDEMISYLTAVFRAVDTLDSVSLLDGARVPPEEAAVLTAERVFQEADSNRDGKLTFQEFSTWHGSKDLLQADGSLRELVTESAHKWLSVQEARRLTGLSTHNVRRVVEAFGKEAENGTLNRPAFFRCFSQLIPDHHPTHTASGRSVVESEEEKKGDNGFGDPGRGGRARRTRNVSMSNESQRRLERARTNVVLNRLFDVFDTSRSGRVSYNELAAGLCLLCGGSHNEKMRTAFRMFDLDGDGFISYSEMRGYLASMYKVFYQLQPQLQASTGVSSDELADITARQAIVDADTDKDGRISFDEFQVWYSASGPGAEEQTNTAATAASEPSSSSSSVAATRPLSALESTRAALFCGEYLPEDVVEVLMNHTEPVRQGTEHEEERYFGDRVVSRSQFDEAMYQLVSLVLQRRGRGFFASDIAQLNAATSLIYDELAAVYTGNRDADSVLSLSSLASAVCSILDLDARTRAQLAFALYDTNRDGRLTRRQVTDHLTSSLAILVALSPSFREACLDQDIDLARILVTTLFEEVAQKYEESLDGRTDGRDVTFAQAAATIVAARRQDDNEASIGLQDFEEWCAADPSLLGERTLSVLQQMRAQGHAVSSSNVCPADSAALDMIGSAYAEDEDGGADGDDENRASQVTPARAPFHLRQQERYADRPASRQSTRPGHGIYFPQAAYAVQPSPVRGGPDGTDGVARGRSSGSSGSGSAAPSVKRRNHDRSVRDRATPDANEPAGDRSVASGASTGSSGTTGRKKRRSGSRRGGGGGGRSSRQRRDGSRSASNNENSSNINSPLPTATPGTATSSEDGGDDQSSAASGALSEASMTRALFKAKSDLCLRFFSATELFDVVREACSSQGMSLSSWMHAVSSLRSLAGQSAQDDRSTDSGISASRDLALKIFQAFDVEDAGVIRDPADLICAVTALCESDPVEKVSVAFKLLMDKAARRDGLTLAQWVRYVQAIFTLVWTVCGIPVDQNRATLQRSATRGAQAMFMSAGMNRGDLLDRKTAGKLAEASVRMVSTGGEGNS